MTTNTRVVTAPPEKVWAVLADGWTYPLWVVGATRMRDVDAGWPAAGTLIHHSVGAWPLTRDDTSEVLECDPGRRLLLRVRAWPGGEAEVETVLTAHPRGTEVRMVERVVSGPGRLVPLPVRHVGLKWRNTETLRRLSFVAQR